MNDIKTKITDKKFETTYETPLNMLIGGAFNDERLSKESLTLALTAVGMCKPT